VSSGITALLNHESKIDGQTLVACGRAHCCICADRNLAEFGGKTNGATLEFGWDLELRHPFFEAEHLRQSAEVDVPKALVPQHPQG
jgi:hypothetical protein